MRTYSIKTAICFALAVVWLTGCGDNSMNFSYDGNNFRYPGYNNFGAIFKDPAFEGKSEFSFEEDEAGLTTLRIEGINGNIIVTGVSDADHVTVQGTKKTGSSTLFDTKEQLDEIIVLSKRSGNELQIKTMQPSSGSGRSYRVDYEIKAPQGMEVYVKNSNGDISLDGINGDAHVDLTNGNVNADITLNINGTVEIETDNGNVSLTVPTDTSAYLTASVNLGNIVIDNLYLFDETSGFKTLSGTLGSGQGMIRLESTCAGSVFVTGR